MKIPESFPVGPFEYKIERGVKGDEWLARCGRMGESDHYENVVRLQSHLPPQQVNETFWHEVCHCIDHVMLNDEMDENAVACFARGMYQVVKHLGLVFEEEQ